MDTFEFRNKRYDWIFWDWLWTLYSPESEALFEWVLPFFDRYGNNVNHVLVSYASSYETRVRLIERLGMGNYFKAIEVGKLDKKGVFESLLDKYALDKSKVLVIGDNLEKEIKDAKELGLDAIPVDLFVSSLV